MATKKVSQTIKVASKGAKPASKATPAALAASAKILTEKYRSHAEDTGSTEVQVALLSERIGSLAAHLKEHAKDHDSRRGLLLMVGKRRRLLNYLKKENMVSYQKLIVDLGLRK